MLLHLPPASPCSAGLQMARCDTTRWQADISQPRLKNNRYAGVFAMRGLFRAYAYPALYPGDTRSTRIR